MKNKWNLVTLLESKMIGTNVMALVFDAPWWPGHTPGQYIDIRLTAANGYQAERSYSVASTIEEEGRIELGIELLEEGEVSPYLFALEPGAQIEVRGPLGGHFLWDIATPGPLVLIGGGSGVVPLMSMVRHHKLHLSDDSEREVFFLISAKTIGHVLYKDELEKFSRDDVNFHLALTLTEEAPIGWTGYARRADEVMINELFGELHDKRPLFYVCGSNSFVETLSGILVAAGFNPKSIKTERFG